MMKKLILSFLLLFFTVNLVLSQSIGEKHNEVVIEYLNIYGQDAKIDKRDLAQNLYNIYMQKYPNEQGSVTISQINDYFDILFGNRTAIETLTDEDLFRVVDHFNSQNQISEQFAVFTRSLITQIFSSTEELLNFIIAYERANELSTKERNTISNMQDIIQKSDTLWYSTMGKKWDNAQIIIADSVVGALFTLVSGPGGVLAGGAASLAVDACQRQRKC